MSVDRVFCYKQVCVGASLYSTSRVCVKAGEQGMRGGATCAGGLSDGQVSLLFANFPFKPF